MKNESGFKNLRKNRKNNLTKILQYGIYEMGNMTNMETFKKEGWRYERIIIRKKAVWISKS